MARKNPRRRIKAKQADVLQQALIARHAEINDDDAALQQGRVSSPLGNRIGTSPNYRGPRFTSMDAGAPQWYKDGAKAKMQKVKVVFTHAGPRSNVPNTPLNTYGGRKDTKKGD